VVVRMADAFHRPLNVRQIRKNQAHYFGVLIHQGVQQGNPGHSLQAAGGDDGVELGGLALGQGLLARKGGVGFPRSAGAGGFPGKFLEEALIIADKQNSLFHF
jgi:hypothetical protein